MRTHELAKLTWTEARDVLAQKPIVLVPIGAVEPHGPQLPMGADYLVAEHMAHRAAAEKGALVTPTIPFGYCDTVKNTPGTITFELHTLEAIVRDVVISLVRHGVERIVFVNNHRSNAVALAEVGRKLRDEFPVEMAAFFPWGTIIATGQDLYDDFPAVFGHGGEPESSVMSYLHPEHVRMDLAVKDQYDPIWGFPAKGPGQIDFKGAPIDVYMYAEDVTETGTRGNPLVADAGRGEKLVERAVGLLEEFLDAFATVPVQGAGAPTNSPTAVQS